MPSPNPSRQTPAAAAAAATASEPAGNEDEEGGDWRHGLPPMLTPLVRLTRLPDLLPPPPPLPPTGSGFCHSCNRQVQINLDSFTCSVCSDGFVEFNRADPAAGQRNAPPPPPPPPQPFHRQPSRDLLSSIFDDELSWLTDLGSFASTRPPAQASQSAAGRPPLCRLHRHQHHHHFLSPFETASRFAGATTPPEPENHSDDILINMPRILRPVPFADPASAAAAAAAEAPGPIRPADASAAISTGIFAADLAQTRQSGARRRYFARRTGDRYSLRSHAIAGTADHPVQTAIRTGGHPGNPANNNNNNEPTTSANSANDSPIRRRLRAFRSISQRMRDEVPMDLDSSNDEPPARESASTRDPSSSSRRSRSPPFFRYASGSGRGGGGAGFHVNFLDEEDDEDGFLNEHGAIIITTLLNQLRNNHRGPAPASDTQLDALPMVDIDQETFDKNIQCAVCMEDFQMNEKAKQMPCKHLFHEPCIVPWLRLHATCPVCRKNIGGDSPAAEQQATSHRFEIFRPAYNFMTRRQTPTASATATAAAATSSAWSSSSSAAASSSWFSRPRPAAAPTAATTTASSSSSLLFPTRDGRPSSFSSLLAEASQPPPPPATEPVAPRFTLNPRMFRIHFNEAPPVRYMPTTSAATATSSSSSAAAVDGLQPPSRDRFFVRLNLSGVGGASDSPAPRQDPFVFGRSSARNSEAPSQLSFLSSLARLSSMQASEAAAAASRSSTATSPSYYARSSRPPPSSSTSPGSGPSRLVGCRGCRMNPYEFRDRLRTLTTRHQADMRRRAQASFRGTAAGGDQESRPRPQQSLASSGPVISSISLRIGVRPTPAPATLLSPAARNDDSFSSTASSSQSTVTPKAGRARRQSDSDVIELDSDEVSAATSSSSSGGNRSSMTLRSHSTTLNSSPDLSSASASSSLVITIGDDDDDDEEQQPSSSASSGRRMSKRSRETTSAASEAVTSKRSSKSTPPPTAAEATVSRTRTALKTERDTRPARPKKQSKASTSAAARNQTPSPGDNSSSDSAVIFETDHDLLIGLQRRQEEEEEEELLADLIHLDDDDETSSSSEDEGGSSSFELADDQVSAIELDDILDDLDAELNSFTSSSGSRTRTPPNQRIEPARKRRRVQTQRPNDTI